MVMVCMAVSIGLRLATTAGMIIRTVMVFMFGVVMLVAFAAATIAVGFGGRGLCQKLRPAMFTAKVMRLAVSFGVKSRGFIHRHSANGVFSHKLIPFLGGFVAVTIEAAMLGA
jgi:hypothetical protein